MASPVPCVDEPIADLLVTRAGVLHDVGFEMAHVVVYQRVNPFTSGLSEYIGDERVLLSDIFVIDELPRSRDIALALATKRSSSIHPWN